MDKIKDIIEGKVVHSTDGLIVDKNGKGKIILEISIDYFEKQFPRDICYEKLNEYSDYIAKLIDKDVNGD